jgi:hypothetical protein
VNIKSYAVVCDCCTVTSLCAVQFEVSASAASFLKENPGLSCLVIIILSAFLRRKYVVEIRVFFNSIIYHECLISQLSVVCALHCPSLVPLTDTYLRIINYFRYSYVSRGLQWSRHIKVALLANPHVANSAFSAEAGLFEHVFKSRQNIIVQIVQYNSPSPSSAVVFQCEILP